MVDRCWEKQLAGAAHGGQWVGVWWHTFLHVLPKSTLTLGAENKQAKVQLGTAFLA